MAEVRELIDQGQVLALDADTIDAWCEQTYYALDDEGQEAFGADGPSNPGGPGVPPFEPYTGPGELRMFLDAKLYRLRVIAGEVDPE